jgi:three-Cys-motif partner protein
MGAAHRVLELEPRWLRRFYLFETDASKIGPLNELRAPHHRDGRRVEVFDEDFNRGVDRILVPDLVPPQHAAFCLLDQYTLECHWSTLQKLADYKSGEKFKVELFYFLAHAWLDRTLSGRTSREGQAGIRAWWGRDDWTSLRDLSGYARAELVAGVGETATQLALPATAALAQRGAFAPPAPWLPLLLRSSLVHLFAAAVVLLLSHEDSYLRRTEP